MQNIFGNRRLCGNIFHYIALQEIWKISLLGNRITNKLMEYLRESIDGGKIVEYYICNQKRFSERVHFQVDWEN